jgi:hypothetical protein
MDKWLKALSIVNPIICLFIVAAFILSMINPSWVFWYLKPHITSNRVAVGMLLFCILCMWLTLVGLVLRGFGVNINGKPIKKRKFIQKPEVLKERISNVSRCVEEAPGKIGEPATKYSMQADIDDLKAKKDIRMLKKVLRKDSDWAVRKRAAQALGTIGDPDAVYSLTIALKDINPNVRMLAAEALGKIGDPRALKPLNAALKDSIPNVEFTVKSVIEKLGWKSEAVLVNKLKNIGPLKGIVPSDWDKWKAYRFKIVESLDAIGWKPNQDAAGAMYWAIKGKWLESGEQSMKSLKLFHPEISVLKEACNSLYTSRSLKTMEALEVYRNYIYSKIRDLERKIAEYDKIHSTWPDNYNRDQMQAVIDTKLMPEIREAEILMSSFRSEQ